MSEAYSEGGNSTALRTMLTQAMIHFEAQIHSFSHQNGQMYSVYSATLSPDGTRVVTASKDKTATLWDVHLETRDPREIAALVKCRVPWKLGKGKLIPAIENCSVFHKLGFPVRKESILQPCGYGTVFAHVRSFQPCSACERRTSDIHHTSWRAACALHIRTRTPVHTRTRRARQRTGSNRRCPEG